MGVQLPSAQSPSFWEGNLNHKSHNLGLKTVAAPGAGEVG